MMTESFRELNRLRRARNAFEHLRAFARSHGLADPDAAAREAVERTHAVGGAEGVPGGSGARRPVQPRSGAGEVRGARQKKSAGGRSSSAAKTASRSGSGAAVPRRLDDRTKEQLYTRAQELDIEGRSNMTREELIAAIREKQ